MKRGAEYERKEGNTKMGGKREDQRRIRDSEIGKGSQGGGNGSNGESVVEKKELSKGNERRT